MDKNTKIILICSSIMLGIAIGAVMCLEAVTIKYLSERRINWYEFLLSELVLFFVMVSYSLGFVISLKNIKLNELKNSHTENKKGE